MAHSDALPIVENLIPDFASDLVFDEKVQGIICDTNSLGWGFDSYDDLKARFSGYEKILFSSTIILSGDRNEDKPFCGSILRVKTEGQLVKQDNHWKVTHYDILEVDLIDY